MKYSSEELDEVYGVILKREFLHLVVLGSLLGALLGLVIFYFFAFIGWALIVAMLVPSALVGFGASLLGKPIQKI